eukprot:m.22590 g.22590  ORF g.22590 m.22590 type:complete len:265 (+) comp11272_c0_seq2:497-1291(+)
MVDASDADIERVENKFGGWKRLSQPATTALAKRIGTEQERETVAQYIRAASRRNAPVGYQGFVHHMCSLLEAREQDEELPLNSAERNLLLTRDVSRDWLRTFALEYHLDINPKSLHRAEAKRMLHNTEARLLNACNHFRDACHNTGLIDEHTGNLSKAAAYRVINIDEMPGGVVPAHANSLSDLVLTDQKNSLLPSRMCAHEQHKGAAGIVTVAAGMFMDGSLTPCMLILADKQPSDDKAAPAAMTASLGSEIDLSGVKGRGLG